MKKLPSGEWEKVDTEITLNLSGKNPSWSFLAVNLAGVSGPEHNLIFEN
jgi:hypothetical protein